LSNPVPWQNWMAAYLGYTLRMRTLFRGWPIMVNDTHTRRRSKAFDSVMHSKLLDKLATLPATLDWKFFMSLHSLRFFGEISSNGCRPPVTATPPVCHDDQQRFEDAKFSRAPWKDWVDCERHASGMEFQSVMVRGKNEYLKTSVRTGNDINFFSLEALVCHDETERWSREMAERLFNAL